MRRVECVYSDLPANKVTLSAIRPARVISDTTGPVTTSTTGKIRGDSGSPSDAEIARRNAILSKDLEALNITPSANKSTHNGVTLKSIDSLAPIWPIETGACKESSTEFLLANLASLWADKSNKSKHQILKENAFIAADLTTSPFLTVCVHQPSLIPLDDQLPEKAIATGWLTTLMRGPNMLFRVFNEAETWRLLDSIYAKDDISHASKCSIWLQLAAGCRFTTGSPQETYDTLFESGCQYLQWCIEQSDEVAPLWVAPPIMLSVLYYMDSKPKTCWLTLGGAIRLAQAHKLDRGRESCPRLSDEEYERWREVWRSMITFDAWLSLTLGKHPQINQDTTQDSFVNMTLEDFALPNDSIEFNIAKLSMLVARVLTSLCKGKMTPSTQEEFFHAIEDWASNLPQNLRYFPDTSDPQTSQANEVGSLYLETFYFASVMTLTKPEFFTSLSTGRQQNSPHSRLFSQACVDASVQIGHAATIILNRGFLCKQSWLITTLVYHAGLVLALSISVQTTSPRYSLKPSGSHSPETQGLEANMEVLSSCAPFNAVAAHFDKVLKYFRALINSYEEAKSAGMSHQMDGRELFRAPPWPPTPSSWRNSSMSTTSPTSTLWQTSPDMPVMYSLPPSSSYQVLAGSDLTAPMNMNNDMSRAAATSYYPQQTIVDPAYIGWPATLPNEGSSYSFVSKSSSRSGHGSIDSGFEHYKPFMQNFWATEPFNSGQQMGNQGNVNTSSGYG